MDFDAEGKVVLQQDSADDGRPPWARVGIRNPLDSLFVHPETHACLFVGDRTAAFSRPTLDQHKIRRVVVCLEDNERPFGAEADFNYLHFPVADWALYSSVTSGVGIARFCAPFLGFVADNLAQGNSVIVHCLAGAHRAGTSGILCLMYLRGLDAATATREAKSKRGVIDPIAHLKKLLAEFEAAQREGVVEAAIASARLLGYEEAMRKMVQNTARLKAQCMR